MDAPPSRPWQFGLRTLLLGTAVCGAMLAVISAAGPLWSVVLAWFAILVAAHVAANAWGSKVPSCRAARPTEEPPAVAVVTVAADLQERVDRRCSEIQAGQGERLRRADGSLTGRSRDADARSTTLGDHLAEQVGQRVSLPRPRTTEEQASGHDRGQLEPLDLVVAGESIAVGP